jgi:GMP synthase PP-ATPase subunit
MDENAWLTTAEAADLLTRVRHVEHNHLIKRKASQPLVQAMCRLGELQDMGVAVEARVTGYAINRTSLLRAVWRIAGQMTAQAAAEMGMSMEQFCAEARPMYEQVLRERRTSR